MGDDVEIYTDETRTKVLHTARFLRQQIAKPPGRPNLCLADLALNLQRGAYGATRGRTYKKDKMSSLDEATFTTAKLLFDDTDQGWRSTSDTGATYLAGALRYRFGSTI